MKAPTASRALIWSVANVAFSKVGTLAIGIVLARVLGPQAFGTYAIAFVALAAVLSFNELGVSLAIVRWQEDPRRIAPTVTTLSITGSAIFFLIGVIVAPQFAAAMGDPEATAVVRWLLVSVLINGLVATPAALLQREFRQGTRTIIDQVNSWLGAMVSIALALLGWGAMSLAMGRLAGAAVSAVMFIFASPLPLRFGLKRAYVGRLLRFGLPLAGASIIVFAIGYLDQVVAGAMLGSTVLGFYVLATNLASWPVSMFSQPLRAVAPAAFARLQDDPAALSQSYSSVFRAVSTVSVPICFLIAGAAGPIISFVYGSQWQPAAAALRWLAVFAAVRIVFELSYDYLVVVRRTAWILFVQSAWIAVLVLGAVLGARWAGAAGIAAAQLIVGGAVVLPLYLLGVRQSGVRLGPALTRNSVPLAIGIAVCAGCLALSALIPNALLACLVCGATGLAGAALAITLDRQAVRDVLRNWGKRSGGEAASAVTAEPASTSEVGEARATSQP